MNASVLNYMNCINHWMLCMKILTALIFNVTFVTQHCLRNILRKSLWGKFQRIKTELRWPGRAFWLGCLFGVLFGLSLLGFFSRQSLSSYSLHSILADVQISFAKNAKISSDLGFFSFLKIKRSFHNEADQAWLSSAVAFMQKIKSFCEVVTPSSA